MDENSGAGLVERKVRGGGNETIAYLNSRKEHREEDFKLHKEEMEQAKKIFGTTVKILKDRK